MYRSYGHEACIHYKDGYCKLHNMRVDLGTPVCPNFTPREKYQATITQPIYQKYNQVYPYPWETYLYNIYPPFYPWKIIPPPPPWIPPWFLNPMLLWYMMMLYYY